MRFFGSVIVCPVRNLKNLAGEDDKISNGVYYNSKEKEVTSSGKRNSKVVQ